jgi:hypothetical protein
VPFIDEIFGTNATEGPDVSWRGPVLLLGGIAIGIGLLVVERKKDAKSAAPAAPPVPPPVPAPAPGPGPAPVPAPSGAKGDFDTDPETALARMLASEDGRREIRILVGWITVQRARGRNLYNFITSGKGYGVQKRPGGVVYAGTSANPTPETRVLAAGILNGSLVPSAKIRSVRLGSWVQRKQKQGGVAVTDEDILQKQTTWKEGIWAQVTVKGKETGWMLFSAEKPILRTSTAAPTAKAVLDAVPKVEALD